jgi:hypothetical protein
LEKCRPQNISAAVLEMKEVPDIRRTVIGTRFTTGCGHSWKRRHPRWSVADLRGACADCAVCGELVLIPREQFEGQAAAAVPAAVHAPLFHKHLALESVGDWPADGLGAFSAEFAVRCAGGTPVGGI